MPALLGQNFVIKESLRAYILRERAKKEEGKIRSFGCYIFLSFNRSRTYSEEAQTSAREQQIKEREQKAKLDSLTLEQTREKVSLKPRFSSTLNFH